MLNAKTNILVHEPELVEVHNGTYTVSNRAGGHRTLKIETILPDSKKPPHHFRNQNSGRRVIKLMIGPDNETNYTMVAWLNNDGPRMVQRYANDYGIVWTVNTLLDLALNREESRWHERYELMLEGRCLICNKKLTHPESIKKGIGPICAGR